MMNVSKRFGNRSVFRIFFASIILMAFIFLAVSGAFEWQKADAAAPRPFEILVVDSVTGRGIPMAELRTTDDRVFVSDSAGRIAIYEPDMMNQVVWFTVTCIGYEQPAPDMFGMRGFRPKVIPGGSQTLKLRRSNIAERYYRITGSDIYRDTLILGKKAPISQPVHNADVLQHDNVYGEFLIDQPLLNAQPVEYRGKIFWFYGGTLGLDGQRNLRMSVAVSDHPSTGGLSPDKGINLKYITGPDGFPKEMAPFGNDGDMIWFDCTFSVMDERGNERLVAHYRRFADDNMKPVEHGIAVYNDEKEVFEKLVMLDPEEKWRYPQGRAFKYKEGGTEWIYFGNPYPNIRVPAKLEAVKDPAAYEAWSCMDEEAGAPKVLRSSAGKLLYRWTKNSSPMGPLDEYDLYTNGSIELNEAYYLPMDVDGKSRIVLHQGTVSWNPYRKRWVAIGLEEYGIPSLWGEIWYSEAASPTGPWTKAIKIASHDRYSFFNPMHLSFMDQGNGRYIYFEGTFSKSLSSAEFEIPLYDNNRVLYRLDLADRRLRAVWN